MRQERRVTLLGRQLRHVLANLSAPTRAELVAQPYTKNRVTQHTDIPWCRDYATNGHDGTSPGNGQTAAHKTILEKDRPIVPRYSSTDRTNASTERLPLHSTRSASHAIDQVTLALQECGIDAALPEQPRLGHWRTRVADISKADWHQIYSARRARWSARLQERQAERRKDTTNGKVRKVKSGTVIGSDAHRVRSVTVGQLRGLVAPDGSRVGQDVKPVTRSNATRTKSQLTQANIPRPDTSTTLKQGLHNEKRAGGLRVILAECIRQRNLRDGENDRYTPTQEDLVVLKDHKYTPPDVEAWATIVTQRNSHDCMRLLVERSTEYGPRATPLFIFIFLLRRKHIDGQAVVFAVAYIRSLLHEARTEGTMLGRSDLNAFVQPISLISTRLVGHGRRVWPAALPTIADLTCQFFVIQNSQHSAKVSEDLRQQTFLLNKLMGSISQPLRYLPFKEQPSQWDAVITILRHMSEHSLHISREGYRAVTRLQLTQPKTDAEREWAELKSPSWPPWKHDRTGLDAALITPSESGISRAGQTLARMRAAGYAWLAWEKAANIYAGWDTDWTPTIQSRVLFPRQRRHQRHESRIDTEHGDFWAARINATRTVQEAWACYLAWVDGTPRHSEMVYLAIFTKLRREEERRAQETVKTRDAAPPAASNALSGSDRMRSFVEENLFRPPAWPLLPGDTKAIEPLPASIHQHTYTRTAPPTVLELYLHLQRNRILFEGPALAFLLTCAESLQQALWYIKSSSLPMAQQHALMSFASDHPALRDVRPVVFAAVIKMLARFAHVRRSKKYRLAGVQPGETIGETAVERSGEDGNTVLSQTHTNAREYQAASDCTSGPRAAERQPDATSISLFASTYHVSSNSCIAGAINMLHAVSTADPLILPALLSSLARPDFLAPLCSVVFRSDGRSSVRPLRNKMPNSTFLTGAIWEEGSKRRVGALVAHAVATELLRVEREHDRTISGAAFEKYCAIAQITVQSGWRLLRWSETDIVVSQGHEDPDLAPVLAECRSLLSPDGAGVDVGLAKHVRATFASMTQARAMNSCKVDDKPRSEEQQAILSQLAAAQRFFGMEVSSSALPESEIPRSAPADMSLPTYDNAAASSTQDDQTASLSPASLPRLLYVPGPSLLHIYARLLGYLGDHDGLVELALWLREHHSEVALRAERDRNGSDMLRKFACAMRVFLERSWLTNTPSSGLSSHLASPEGGVPASDEISAEHDGNRADNFFTVSRFFGLGNRKKRQGTVSADVAGLPSSSESVQRDSLASVPCESETAALLTRLGSPAPRTVIARVQGILNESNIGGWPSDHEIKIYIDRMRK